MSKNLKEMVINGYECQWTGSNKKEIERFFKLIDFPIYSFVSENGKWLLYVHKLVEKDDILIGSKGMGLIAVI